MQERGAKTTPKRKYQSGEKASWLQLRKLCGLCAVETSLFGKEGWGGGIKGGVGGGNPKLRG